MPILGETQRSKSFPIAPQNAVQKEIDHRPGIVPILQVETYRPRDQGSFPFEHITEGFRRDVSSL